MQRTETVTINGGTTASFTLVYETVTKTVEDGVETDRDTDNVTKNVKISAVPGVTSKEVRDFTAEANNAAGGNSPLLDASFNAEGWIGTENTKLKRKASELDEKIRQVLGRYRYPDEPSPISALEPYMGKEYPTGSMDTGDYLDVGIDTNNTRVSNVTGCEAAYSVTFDAGIQDA